MEIPLPPIDLEQGGYANMDPNADQANVEQVNAEQVNVEQSHPIVPEYVQLGPFKKIRIIQSNPLPQSTTFLMINGLEGLEFYKIPISDKDSVMYLKQAIIPILSITGLDTSFIIDLLEKYNKKENDENKTALLGLIQMTQYYVKLHNYEFLLD